MLVLTCLPGKGALHRKTRSESARRRVGSGLHIGALCLLLISVFSRASGAQEQEQPDPDPTEAPVTETSKRVSRFTASDRLRFYYGTTFRPFALTGPVLGAAFTQWTTRNPPEWGQGFSGFGRRLASGFGRQAIANTIGLSVGAMVHEDPRHYPTGQHGLWRRGLYAARQSVISRNASSGELMPAYSRIVGVYSAGFVSNVWYPDRFSNVHDALWRGSTALASDIIWQEFKEFWPDVRHRLPFRR